MVFKTGAISASLLGLALSSFQPYTVTAQTLPASAAIGAGPGTRLAAPFARNAAARDVADPADPDTVLVQPSFQLDQINTVRLFTRTCDCLVRQSDDDLALTTGNIRGISEVFTADGNAVNSFGLSNMVWSFGQFIDHDVALGIEDVANGRRFPIGSESGSFNAERELFKFRQQCDTARNIHTGEIDGGMIYGTDDRFLDEILRIPGKCELRVASTPVGEFPPVTTQANAAGQFAFIAGDIRIIEHSFLFAQHTVWLREHNRLCGVARANTPQLSEERLFKLVRDVVVAKLQQVVLTEFLPALGITQLDLETAQRLINVPDTSTEFSMAYRMGHDLVPNFVGDLSVADLFQPVRVFLDVQETPAGTAITFSADSDNLINSLMSNLASSPANELDGQVSDALRNSLFGRKSPDNPMGGQDLVGRNIFRSRDVSLPTYAGLAQCFGITPDAQTELETPDAWVGLVREPRAPGNVFGPTQRAIIVEQFHRSFFGPGGLFWRNTPSRLGAFLPEVESSTYAQIINANTNANVAGNVFSV